MQPDRSDHPRYRLLTVPGSRKLAVFFTGTGEADGRFHFYGVAKRCGENALLLNNGSNRWYQTGVPGLGQTLEETLATIRAWSAALEAPEIFCVGASMGGSGAALYGAMLGAPTLAMGFEARLGLEQSRSAKLVDPDFTFPMPDLTPILAAATAPIHVYIGSDDPEDVHATAHLRDLPMVTMTALRGVGHAPPWYLKRVGRLDDMIAALLTGDPMPDMPERDDTAFVDGFSEALHETWCGHRTVDVPRWIAGGERAVVLNPSSNTAAYWLGRAYLKAGRHREALTMLGTAAALDRCHQDSAYYFANTLRVMGYPDAALALHASSIDRWPKAAKPHYDSGIIYDLRSAYRQSVVHLEKAVELDPLNKAFNARLAKVRMKLKSADTEALQQGAGELAL